MDLHVLPECYIDTKLIKTLLPPKPRYNHQKGTNVLTRMQDEFSDSFALGVCDEDFKDRAYVEEFREIYCLADALRLFKHPLRHHYIILRCPGAEKWDIAAAEEAGLHLSEFDLPHDYLKLRKITKTSKSEEHDPYSDNFRRLFKALKQHKPLRIAVLTFWMDYLKTNPYTADINWLIEETNRLLDR